MTPQIIVACGRCDGYVPITHVRMVFGPPDAPLAVAGFDDALHYHRWQRPKPERETATLRPWETR